MVDIYSQEAIPSLLHYFVSTCFSHYDQHGCCRCVYQGRLEYGKFITNITVDFCAAVLSLRHYIFICGVSCLPIGRGYLHRFCVCGSLMFALVMLLFIWLLVDSVFLGIAIVDLATVIYICISVAVEGRWHLYLCCYNSSQCYAECYGYSVDLLLIYCFVYLPLFVGVLCWSLFCMHYFMSFLVLQSSWRGRELLLSFWCLVTENVL